MNIALSFSLGVAQMVVEHLSSKHEALNSNPILPQNKKE
jgi:hypothetical protein